MADLSVPPLASAQPSPERRRLPRLDAAGALLTIDLGALRSNFRSLRRQLPGSVCGAVVKANAYGLGVEHVGPALMAEGCATFFVAHLSEGLALREAVGERPGIFVLNGLHPGAEPDCAAAGLIPVLNSTAQVAAWRIEAATLGSRLPAALQVDSGMARLGMSSGEVDTLAADPSALDGIEVCLVMSHLARADEPEATANGSQLARFEELAAKLPAAPRSLSNSSGIFLGAAYHFDIARPGAALYGINPTPGRPNPMKPVVRLQARVIQTRDVGRGEGIGYGHAKVADRPMRTATISLGYADGWHRRAQASAFFDGQALPFVGRVSMDSIVIDVSSLPRDSLNGGDLVDLIGDRQSVDDVAVAAGTIGYEVLTSLGSRPRRIYVDDDFAGPTPKDAP